MWDKWSGFPLGVLQVKLKNCIYSDTCLQVCSGVWSKTSMFFIFNVCFMNVFIVLQWQEVLHFYLINALQLQSSTDTTTLRIKSNVKYGWLSSNFVTKNIKEMSGTNQVFQWKISDGFLPFWKQSQNILFFSFFFFFSPFHVCVYVTWNFDYLIPL